MSSQNNQTPPPTHHPRFKSKTLILCSSAILSLILALSLNTTTNPLSFLKPTLLQKHPKPPQRPPCVLWMAPFLSPGGYSSEAWSYITSLSTNINPPNFTLQIHHHGDLQSLEFWQGLPLQSKSLAQTLYNTPQCTLNHTIVICHSEPGAWFPPLFQTFPCPPTGYEHPFFVVGRTMFETDRLTPEHVKRCNRMNAVWVPTEFHVSTFANSGVDRSKIVKLVQPVDVNFFDPAKHNALPLSTQKLVLGASHCGEKFVFLSVFKWEDRKGWDVLLKAFLEEFSNSDGVALYLLVSAYHSDADFGAKITNFIGEFGLKEPVGGWAPVYVIDKHVPQFDLPIIYKAADAFVLPSRGEGWGRPIVEAMAMALPVIATNWSGPTEYLTEENGYPLPVDRTSKVREGPFKGHLWAEPSSQRLRVLMRKVVTDPEEGRRRGRRARADMIERFSPEVVAQLVAEEIMKILENHGRRNEI